MNITTKKAFVVLFFVPRGSVQARAVLEQVLRLETTVTHA